jgi:hypothetical protein
MSIEKIPGIYNFCDRWCERCQFGSRCAVYEDENGLSSEEKDMNNKAFWDRLSLNFSKAHKFLEQAAAHQGINLHTIAKEAEGMEEKKQRIQQSSKDHPISKLSWDYSEASRGWLKSQPGMLDKLEQLRDGLTMGIESVADAKVKTKTIKECLAVIQWYETFIHVKMMRALMAKMNYDELNVEGYQNDSNGSAKIALLAIERSTHAWIQIYDLLPEREDDFLNILAMLEKLKAMILKQFPDAMKFRRPGFDD